MNIDILTVGKLKESYLQDAAKEYTKRLSRYIKLNIMEIAEEKAKEPLSDAAIQNVLHKEGERIMRHLHTDSYKIALVIEGNSLSSTAFAQKIHQLGTYGKSHITFLIGGSYGLSKEVTKKTDYSLSFSSFTFPHQLMRVFLLEQIYRACKINNGESYHK